MVDQFEVDRTNFAGRLHPSQRGKVLNNLWIGVFMVAAGVVILAIAPKDSGAIFFVYMLPVIVMLAFGVVMCVRRLLDVSQGKLVPFTGWTHDGGARRGRKDMPQYPIVRYTSLTRGGNTLYNVRVGDRGFGVKKELYARIQPERNNTAFLSPRTKQLINVAPTP
jgi:hypothetical protein